MKNLEYSMLPLLCVLACSSGGDGSGTNGTDDSAGSTGGGAAGASGGTATMEGDGGSGGSSGATVMNQAGSSGQGGVGGGGSSAGGATDDGGQGGVATGGTAGSGGAGGMTQQMSPEERLYTLNCLPCHGAEGVGGAKGPEVQHPVADFTVWIVRNGSDARGPTSYSAPMTPLGETFLSAADLDTIIGYLNSFPKPTTGEGLYLDYCANCHGKDAKGGITTHDLTKLDNPATEVHDKVRSGNHLGDFPNRTEYMPKRDVADLTDDDLSMIVSYLGTL